MSNCSVCGSVEYWHADGEGTMAKPTCHKCLPPTVTILPPDGDGGHSHKYDIEEAEVTPPVNSAKGSTGNCPPALTFNDDPDVGIYGPNGSVSFGVSSGPTSIEMDGAKVMTVYDELPETAEQGKMACKKGEDVTYVFDGEEWQNLGEALLGKRRNVLTPRDKKINRRAAIEATKAKDAE